MGDELEHLKEVEEHELCGEITKNIYIRINVVVEMEKISTKKEQG